MRWASERAWRTADAEQHDCSASLSGSRHSSSVTAATSSAPREHSGAAGRAGVRTGRLVTEPDGVLEMLGESLVSHVPASVRRASRSERDVRESVIGTGALCGLPLPSMPFLRNTRILLVVIALLIGG